MLKLSPEIKCEMGVVVLPYLQDFYGGEMLSKSANEIFQKFYWNNEKVLYFYFQKKRW